MYFSPVAWDLILFTLKIKCIMEQPSIKTYSASSQLVWLYLEVAFQLLASKIIDPRSALSSCPLQLSMLLQPFAKTTNL